VTDYDRLKTDYDRLKWRTAGRIVGAGAAVTLVVLPWSRPGALAVAAGVACGLANVLATMRSSERLLDTRNKVVFGLSSLLRLAGFSIVAAAFAARGPWWSLGPFLAGFFFPLAAYAWGASRGFKQTDRNA
jgi:hypothetical protein